MTKTPPDRGDDIAMRLERLVPIVRQRLALTDAIEDAAILQSLHEIVRARNPAARWSAAFNSTLGLYLVLREHDLDGALNRLLAILPPTRR